MIRVGYVGGEVFDIVLYIARTLTKLKLRVLIIDLSDTGSFQKIIKHGMGLDSSKEIINYRDINYSRIIPNKEELSLFENGVVFIIYGNTANSHLLECNRLVTVVNPFPSMIDHVNELMKHYWNAENYDLLIRDLLFEEDAERISNDLNYPYEKNNIHYLYLDLRDYENAVRCQKSQIIQFIKISSSMKRYITSQLKEMLPELTTRQIRKAINTARKGV